MNSILKPRKIVFLTGTRADFGKIKSLLEICSRTENIIPYIFVTGMHMNKRYGATVNEIKKTISVRKIV